MNFCLIVPTRGDRPQFIEQAKKMIDRQVLKPSKVFWIDYKPESDEKDITQRYRRGIELATKEGYDFAVFWEDDDWYSKYYLDWLVKSWIKAEKPNIFACRETYYYNIHCDMSWYQRNHKRPSAFLMLIKLPCNIQWPKDSYPNLDLYIAKNNNIVTTDFPISGPLAIGIKHGTGKCGGRGHRIDFPYRKEDREQWFKDIVGSDFHFYNSLKKPQSFNINKRDKKPINISKRKVFKLKKK